MVFAFSYFDLSVHLVIFSLVYSVMWHPECLCIADTVLLR